MNFKSLLIITYGRSGSTLLQGLLNSIDGCVVRGENHDLFYDLFTVDKKIGEMPRSDANRSPQDPWFGSHLYNKKFYRQMVKHFARETLLAGIGDKSSVKCYGFKEIRYVHHAEDLGDYLSFLRKVFPDPAFIFNVRSHDDVAKSGWWGEQSPKDVKAKLEKIEVKFEEYADNHDNSFLIAYDDVVNAGDKLRELYEFIGADYDKELVASVLSRPHSYAPVQIRVRKLKRS